MINDKKYTNKQLHSSELFVKENEYLDQITELSVDRIELESNETKLNTDTFESTVNVSKQICEYCGTKEKSFMFTCRRCGMHLCLRHRIPELHECVSVTWKITDKYIKHFLNDYAVPESTHWEGKKKVKKE
jgi:ribosomal protein L40E